MANVLVTEEAQPWFASTGENFYFDPSIWLKNTLFETVSRLFFYKKEPQVLLVLGDFGKDERD